MENLRQNTPFQERLHQFEVKTGLTDKEIESLSRDELYEKLMSNIGNTPVRVVDLGGGNTLLQKDETANPTETHYDRVFVPLIRVLEEEGKIQPGDVLLETSSGSAGIAFAWACKKLGYKSVLFTPGYLPAPRRIEAENLADEVHYGTDKTRYLEECAEMMVKYLRDNRVAAKNNGKRIRLLNHSQDYRTPMCFNNVGAELVNYLASNNIQQVDYFVMGIGNGSTIYGIPGWLKNVFPQQFGDIKVIGYEPMQAAHYYKKFVDRWGGLVREKVDRLLNGATLPERDSVHLMPGTGTLPGLTFPFNEDAVHLGMIDDVVPVNVEFVLSENRYNDDLPDVKKMGVSSQVARYVTEEVLSGQSGKVAVSLIYDKADRY